MIDPDPQPDPVTLMDNLDVVAFFVAAAGGLTMILTGRVLGIVLLVASIIGLALSERKEGSG